MTCPCQTHFFVPFALPSWLFGTIQSVDWAEHFSQRSWPAGRLHRILLRRQFRHAGCLPGPLDSMMVMEFADFPA